MTHLCASSALVMQRAVFTCPMQRHAPRKLTERAMHRTQAGLGPALGGAAGASGPASGRTRSLSSDSSADFAALAADAALVAHDLMAAEGGSGMAADDTPAAGACTGAVAEHVAAAEVAESASAPELALELGRAGGGRQQAPAGEPCSPRHLSEELQSCRKCGVHPR